MALDDSSIQGATLKHLGPEYKVLSWFRKDFTKKGDNFASVVTSAEVIVINEKEKLSPLNILQSCNDHDTSKDPNDLVNSNRRPIVFIVKILPERADGPFRSLLSALHAHESALLTLITPRINKVLQSLGEKKLEVPDCYFSRCDDRKEILITEDMRQYGYRMIDRKLGPNEQQLLSVIQGLAKLHASSYVLRKLNNNEDFDATYPVIRDPLQDLNHASMPFYKQVYMGNLKGTAMLLESLGGYGHVVEWINRFIPTHIELMSKQLSSDDKFQVICHGDSWTNNFLFR